MGVRRDPRRLQKVVPSDIESLLLYEARQDIMSMADAD